MNDTNMKTLKRNDVNGGDDCFIEGIIKKNIDVSKYFTSHRKN